MRKICSLYNEDMRKQVLNILSLLLLLLTGCQSRPQNAVTTDQLPEIYPDYTEVTIPTDIAPLNFAMTDDEVTTMDVTVKGVKGLRHRRMAPTGGTKQGCKAHGIGECRKRWAMDSLSRFLHLRQQLSTRRMGHHLSPYSPQLSDLQQDGTLSALSRHF